MIHRTLKIIPGFIQQFIQIIIIQDVTVLSYSKLKSKKLNQNLTFINQNKLSKKDSDL